MSDQKVNSFLALWVVETTTADPARAFSFMHIMQFRIKWAIGYAGPELVSVRPVTAPPVVGFMDEQLGPDMCGKVDDSDIWDMFGDQVDREYKKLSSLV